MTLGPDFGFRRKRLQPLISMFKEIKENSTNDSTNRKSQYEIETVKNVKIKTTIENS